MPPGPIGPPNHEIHYPNGLSQETMPDGSQQLFGTDDKGVMHRLDYNWVLQDYDDAAGNPAMPQGPRPPAEYTNDFEHIVQTPDKNGVNRLYGVDKHGKKKAVSVGRILLAHGYDPKKDVQGPAPVPPTMEEIIDLELARQRFERQRAEQEKERELDRMIGALAASAAEITEATRIATAAPIRVVRAEDAVLPKGDKGRVYFKPTKVWGGRSNKGKDEKVFILDPEPAVELSKRGKKAAKKEHTSRRAARRADKERAKQSMHQQNVSRISGAGNSYRPRTKRKYIRSAQKYSNVTPHAKVTPILRRSKAPGARYTVPRHLLTDKDGKPLAA